MKIGNREVRIGRDGIDGRKGNRVVQDVIGISLVVGAAITIVLTWLGYFDR